MWTQPEAVSYQELFTQFLVEGVREQIGEARENLDTIQRQVSEVSKQQEQWSHGRVNDRHLDLKTRDELHSTKYKLWDNVQLMKENKMI